MKQLYIKASVLRGCYTVSLVKGFRRFEESEYLHLT